MSLLCAATRSGKCVVEVLNIGNHRYTNSLLFGMIALMLSAWFTSRFTRSLEFHFICLNPPIQHIAIELSFLCQSKLHRWKIDSTSVPLNVDQRIKNDFQSNDANNNMKIASKYHKFTTFQTYWYFKFWVLSFTSYARALVLHSRVIYCVFCKLIHKLLYKLEKNMDNQICDLLYLYAVK